MSNLVQLLTAETKSLKAQYIANCIKWATTRFEVMTERRKWKELQWCLFYGLEPETYNKGREGEFQSFPRGFYNTKKANEYDRDKKECIRITKMGIDEYLSQTEKNAIRHYEDSIEKLAYRIHKKGLNETGLKLHTSHVGVNIETTITDGNTTVRAWTIIAFGEIQQPHYRYLIK